MNKLIEAINEAVKREGIDLIGFAPKERFSSLDERKNPFTIFPEGKTVIMLGKRVCRGSLRGVEEGTNFSDYNFFGRCWLEDEFLALACYNMTRVLEDHGWEAVPVFPNPTDMSPMGVSVAEGRAEPNVFPDFDYAAVAAGLCEYGLSGLVMSPKFGVRQRFHMIITDAELPPTPMLTESVCDRCGKCAAACPLGAINTENTVTVTVAGKEMTVATVDLSKCRTCKNGACANRFDSKLTPDRMAALCSRTCVSHMESAKDVGEFEKPFRKRDAWCVGRGGKVSTSSVEVATEDKRGAKK